MDIKVVGSYSTQTIEEEIESKQRVVLIFQYFLVYFLEFALKIIVDSI